MNRSFFKPKCRQSIHENDDTTTGSSIVSSTSSSNNKSYSLRFLEYGFTYTGTVEYPKPKCLICYHVFNNNQMTPDYLQAHLATQHKEYRNKTRDFFKKQLDKLKKSQNKNHNSTLMNWTVEDIVSPSRKSINRKYSEEYLKFGFTYIGNDAAKPKPKCLLCYEILPNSSMEESSLHDHLVSKHAEYKEKPVEFFAKQLEKIEKAKTKSRRSSCGMPTLATISTPPPPNITIEKPLEKVSTNLRRSSSVYNVPVAQIAPNVAKPQTPKKSNTSRKSTAGRKSIGQKYLDEFLKFGFTYIGDEMKPKPKCLLCYEILSNSCMHESALHEHLTTKHQNYIDKPVEFFAKQLKKYLKSQGRVG